MSKVTRQSEIDKYELGGNRVFVQYSNPQDIESTLYEVDRPAFEFWLQQTGKLEWFTNTPERDYDGVMTAQQYWDNEDDAITRDLLDFMLMIDTKAVTALSNQCKAIVEETLASVTTPKFAKAIMEQVQTIVEHERHLQQMEAIPPRLHLDHVLQLMGANS